jgi:hypothetical protein
MERGNRRYSDSVGAAFLGSYRMVVSPNLHGNGVSGLVLALFLRGERSVPYRGGIDVAFGG